MNENFNLYVEQGKANLSSRRQAEEEEAAVAEQARCARNREEWLAHLQSVYGSIPCDLYEYVAFDDTKEPVSYRSGTPRVRYADFTYVPYVPVRIMTNHRGEDIAYAVGKAEHIAIDEAGNRSIEHSYYDTYPDIFEAIAAASAMMEQNASFESLLSAPAPDDPEPDEPKKTPLQHAHWYAVRGKPDDARLWALLSIAESLENISRTLGDDVLHVRDADSY